MISAGLLTLTLIDGRPLDRPRAWPNRRVPTAIWLILSVIDLEVEFTPSSRPLLGGGGAQPCPLATVTEATTRMVAAAVAAATVLTAVGVLALAWWRGLAGGD